VKRLIRAALWLGLLAAVMWIARTALKAWIDGPEVTPTSGGWPTGTSERTASPATVPVETADRPAPAAAEAAGDKPAAAKKSAGTRKKASKRAADSGNWVLPNGSDEILRTHPVKVKLGSRVYRVPGMPMYGRTVADRCYATVEEAEADGFNRAVR
jgi:hypothetical protein